MAKIYSKFSRSYINKFVADLPDIINGSKPDVHNINKVFWGAVAYSMFSSIYKAYQEKSKLNTDELGDSWDDLTQKTKAYKRPAYPGDLTPSLERRLKSRTLGLLTPGEHRKWQRIWATLYHSFKHKMADEEAKALAAQIAWTQLKQSGAKTKLDVLGNRNVLVMRKSGRLMLSLSPGKFYPNSGYKKFNSDQIFELTGDSIIIGTDVEYASFHDSTRPIWPDDIGPWMDKALEVGRDYLYNKLKIVLT